MSCTAFYRGDLFSETRDGALDDRSAGTVDYLHSYYIGWRTEKDTKARKCYMAGIPQAVLLELTGTYTCIAYTHV